LAKSFPSTLTSSSYYYSVAEQYLDRIIDFSLRYFDICYANSANYHNINADIPKPTRALRFAHIDAGLSLLLCREYQQMSIDLHELVVFV
jgi:hypothetical protein